MPEARPALHGIVVLAAGRSQRLGQSKQLLLIDGESLVHRAARYALDTAPADCVVVTRLDADEIALSVADLNCRIVPCADAESGMSASLRCGLAALSPICDGALIVVTDQPMIGFPHLAALRDRWRYDPDHAVASGYAGTFGVPAMLPRAWFATLMENEHEHGARDLLRARSEQVHVISAPELAFDLDTPADLVRANLAGR